LQKGLARFSGLIEVLISQVVWPDQSWPIGLSLP